MAGGCGRQVGLGRGHRRLRDIDLHLVRRPIEFDEDVALVNPVVVIDQHPLDLPGNPRGHEGHVVAHVGIVGGYGRPRPMDPGNADPKTDEQEQNSVADQQNPPRRPAMRCCRGLRGGAAACGLESSTRAAASSARRAGLGESFDMAISHTCFNARHASHEKLPVEFYAGTQETGK